MLWWTSSTCAKREKPRLAEAETKAAENRATFGRSKAERVMGEAETRLAQRRLEAHRLRGDGTE